MPGGPPWATLPDLQTPWPTQTGKPAGYTMLGYRLDAQRRPTFQYTFHSVRVTETPAAVPGELEASLSRTFNLHATSDVDPFWFRAWVGNLIEERPDGAFLADGKVELKFDPQPNDQKPVIRQSAGKAELLVPITFNNLRASLVEHITW
jgi:hypothetical protein